MPSVVTRILFFLSSYFPLSLIFFVILFSEHYKVAGCDFDSRDGEQAVYWMLLYVKKAKNLSPFQWKIAALHKRDTEVMAYNVTYIIPFLAVPLHGWNEGTALSIFVIVFGILCPRL